LIETVDRRILGAFVCVDAITGSSVVPAIPVTSAQWNVKANRSGTYVIFDGPGFDALTTQFVPSGTWPAAPTQYEVTLQDSNLRYLPRRAMVSAPAAVPAIPPVSATPTGVFAPQQVTVFPSPAAAVGPNWATIRVSVTQAGTTPPRGLPYAIVQVINTDGSAVLATGQTDSNGEALLAVIGPTLQPNPQGGGDVTVSTVSATATAYFLPRNLTQPSGWIPNPDDILNDLTNTALVTSSSPVTFSSGQDQSLSLALTLPPTP
jgi:hypothetical protein